MWNSLRIIQGNTPVAITSTDAFSSTSTAVWMIKGHVIPEFHIPAGTPILDGLPDDACWQKDWPYFVGHTSRSQLTANLCKDNQYLYVAVKVDGPASANQNQTADAFSFFLDATRKSFEAPHTGVFSFTVKKDGSVTIKQGLNGLWVQDKSGTKIKIGQTVNGETHTVELAIPFSILPGTFGQNNSVGINFVLHTSVDEPLSATNLNQPYTWVRAFLPN